MNVLRSGEVRANMGTAENQSLPGAPTACPSAALVPGQAMSWSLVIAVLLGAPTVAPCAGAVYGGSHRPNPGFPSRAESGAITSDSAASGDVLGVGMGFSSAAGHEGEGAEDLRRFASTRVMKTGTTIAGVVFEVSAAVGRPFKCLSPYMCASVLGVVGSAISCAYSSLLLVARIPPEWQPRRMFIKSGRTNWVRKSIAFRGLWFLELSVRKERSSVLHRVTKDICNSSKLPQDGSRGLLQGGVVLGADTRATGGKTVCDRNCDKIHVLASNIACCGAGTSADAVKITEVGWAVTAAVFL